MNILCLISYQFLPARFGGQKGIGLFYRYFSRRVNMVCVTVKSNDPKLAEGYPLLNILSNHSLRYINLFYYFRLKKIIKERQITHLLLEHPYYGWLAILIKKFTSVKLVIRSHNIEGTRWKTLGKWWWKILWRYERMVHRAADHSFFVQQDEMNYAIQQFGLSPEKCTVATFGIELNEAPSAIEKAAAKKTIQQQHGIPGDDKILLYNGAFNYYPNLEGLYKIINTINPILQQQPLPYTIIICGGNIPDAVKQQSVPGVIIAGFVDDISVYFKGADVFLNPIIEGGGIKTKVIEAIGYSTTVVSTQSGATGMETAVCGEKLVVKADTDWQGFANAVMEAAESNAVTPAAYYQHYYLGNIVNNVATVLESENQS